MRGVQLIIIVVGSVTLAGCEATDPHERATQLAEARFNRSKADLKFLLATDQYENGLIEQAKQSIQEALGLSAEDPEYYLLLAKIFIEQGDLAGAGQALKTVGQLLPENAELGYLSGILDERYGRLPEALDHYRQAHELDCGNLDYLLAYAETLVNLDRASEALDLIEDRIDAFGGHGRLQSLKGEILNLMGHFHEAAAAFKLATLQFPDDNQLLEAYAISLYRGRDYADAIAPLRALYTQLRAQLPDHALRALAHCYMEIGGYESALIYWQEIDRRHPDDYRARLLQGHCYIGMRDYDSALHTARHAVRLAPEKPGTQLLLGMVYWKLENWIQARKALEAALRADPRDVTALCLLGRVVEASGQPQLAGGYYRQALAVDPENRLARHLLEALGGVAPPSAHPEPARSE